MPVVTIKRAGVTYFSRVALSVGPVSRLYVYTRLVSNSVPTWSSRCCFTACHFWFGKSLGRNAIIIQPNDKRTQLEMSQVYCRCRNARPHFLSSASLSLSFSQRPRSCTACQRARGRRWWRPAQLRPAPLLLLLLLFMIIIIIIIIIISSSSSSSSSSSNTIISTDGGGLLSRGQFLYWELSYLWPSLELLLPIWYLYAQSPYSDYPY